MAKHWQEWGEDCPSCGGTSEILTISAEPHMGYDQDDARCMECHCPGMLSVMDTDQACVVWDIDNHEMGCDCSWCTAAWWDGA